MEKLKPILFSSMKTYNKQQLIKDVIAGIIVAIIALPLSIALALASGVSPERGIYTAIIAGFVISFLGGSKVQISGPTAAFATIVAGIVAKNGINGLIVATIMAGIMLILMGLFKFGELIKFIPYTITTGFTAGIAVTILIGQIPSFLELTITTKEPLIHTVDKVSAIFEYMNTINWSALIVGLLCLAVLIIWEFIPGFLSKIPGYLVAVILSSSLVALLNIPVNTIGDSYNISNALPTLSIPDVNFEMIQTLLPDAFTIAVLAGIVSLLSCVVADSMTGNRHRSNMELVAQGTGNIASALFGGIPATGAIARTAANIKNGGRSPISGIVHSITLLLILVILMPYAALIPMPTMAAILFIVSYNMCGWKEFVNLCKTAPKSDTIVLVLTFVLTVVFDLVVAIEIGMLIAVLLFMKRMSNVSDVYGWKYVDEDDESPDDGSLSLKTVPKNTLVYELNGPMFFAVADKLFKIDVHDTTNCLILRMRSVNSIDATAMMNFEKLLEKCKKQNVTLILSHVDEQPLSIMRKSGFDKRVGLENFCPNIDTALARANDIK